MLKQVCSGEWWCYMGLIAIVIIIGGTFAGVCLGEAIWSITRYWDKRQQRKRLDKGGFQ